MKYLKRAALFSAVLLSALGAPAQAGLFDRTPKPVILEVQGNRAEEFKQLVRDDSALEKVAKVAAPEPAKVAIAKIRLNFATQSSAASTEGRPGGKTSSQYVDYSLLKVSNDDVQKMADLFYADLVKLLGSKGYVVQPPEYLLTDPKFAQAVAQTKSPVESEALVKKEKTVTAIAKQTAQFSGMGNGGMDYYALSKAKKDALLLELDFDMDMVAIKKASDSGNWFQWQQIDHKPALHVKSGMVRFHLDGNTAQFSFLEKAMLPGEVFAGAEKKATSATDTAATVFGALMGAGGSSNSYNVLPVENFPEAIAKSLQPFAEVVIQGLPQPAKAATPQ
ncbi:MAG: hypothetical protein HXX19_08765 [Rhodoferax sp.]|nr:hypothetical protein [Rhodoferax sp.]